ncbi:MAG: hypothetical protein Q8916_09450 [Bacteroidota bacterium]|nr:hypothetical protein [Bacteroidota bacterium]
MLIDRIGIRRQLMSLFIHSRESSSKGIFERLPIHLEAFVFIGTLRKEYLHLPSEFLLIPAIWHKIRRLWGVAQ